MLHMRVTSDRRGYFLPPVSLQKSMPPSANVSRGIAHKIVFIFINSYAYYKLSRMANRLIFFLRNVLRDTRLDTRFIEWLGGCKLLQQWGPRSVLLRLVL